MKSRRDGLVVLSRRRSEVEMRTRANIAAAAVAPVGILTCVGSPRRRAHEQRRSVAPC